MLPGHPPRSTTPCSIHFAMKSVLRLLPALALAAAFSPLRADDITDSIDSGKAAYEAGNYSEAITSLDYASQLIRQKKGTDLKAYLPDAPKDWTAEAAEREAAGSSLFGGGITASRRYTNGDKTVTIKIMSDSPILQATMMMLDNSQFLPTGDGVEQLVVKGQKAILTLNTGDTNGDIKTVVDRRYLVEISGSGIERADLMLFAKAFDYSKLSKLQ